MGIQRKSNKGITIIEVIVSLAILGILSYPLSMIFFNSMAVVKRTETQVEASSVMRVIKGNLKYALQNETLDVLPEYGTVNKKKIVTTLTPNPTLTGLGIIDPNDPTKYIEGYKYNLTLISRPVATSNFAHTYKYKISLQDKTGVFIQELFVEINDLD